MDILKGIWELLGHISLLCWIITIILSGTLLYFWRYIKSQFVFGKNLKRKIYFFKTADDKNLQTQKDKLKSLKLFNIEDDIKDISKKIDVLQNLKDDAVYIVGYNNKYNYKDLFDKAENKKIPILIFAYPKEIKDWSLFNNYIYCDVANTTNRLVIILLNILKIV